MGIGVEALQTVALGWRAKQKILRQDVNHNSNMASGGMRPARRAASSHRALEEEP